MSNGDNPQGGNFLTKLAGLVGGGTGGSGVSLDPATLLLEATAMQQQVTQAQQSFEGQTFTGSAGSGAVAVTLNGRYDVLTVTISPSAVSSTNVAGLQQLVQTAFNQAVQQVRAAQVAAIQTVSNGLHIPGLI
jgi:DNA-binding YbaB/EbfC family protein